MSSTRDVSHPAMLPCVASAEPASATHALTAARSAIAKGAGRQLARRRRHDDHDEEPPHAPGAVEHHSELQRCRGLLRRGDPARDA